jgi:uncharacterized oxidoreductase
MDNTDLAALPGHVQTLTSKYPNIDTVWINSGMQSGGDFKSLNNTTDELVVDQVTLNLTAPLILARHFIPYLLSIKREANFLITSSGLGFLGAGAFPVYCPTKAAIHSFMYGLRESLKDTNVNVIEIVPPFVRTNIVDVSKIPLKPMELDDYIQQSLNILEKPAKEIKEVAVGTAYDRVKAWRDAYDPMLKARGSNA